MELHPDKNPNDDQAHAKMVANYRQNSESRTKMIVINFQSKVELNEALQVLVDPDQRTAYDNGGVWPVIQLVIARTEFFYF